MESVRQSKVYFQRFNIVPLKKHCEFAEQTRRFTCALLRTNAAVKRIDILLTAAF